MFDDDMFEELFSVWTEQNPPPPSWASQSISAEFESDDFSPDFDTGVNEWTNQTPPAPSWATE